MLQEIEAVVAEILDFLRTLTASQKDARPALPVTHGRGLTALRASSVATAPTLRSALVAAACEKSALARFVAGEGMVRVPTPNRQLGLKFRRQSTIGPYFADFCGRPN